MLRVSGSVVNQNRDHKRQRVVGIWSGPEAALRDAACGSNPCDIEGGYMDQDKPPFRGSMLGSWHGNNPPFGDRHGDVKKWGLQKQIET